MSLKIIIADDDADFRGTVADTVKDAAPDSVIDQVPDGESLVKAVRNGSYDLVFTDFNMGREHLPGIPAIIEIRKFNADVPIYMISASQVEKQALSAGATGYFDKDPDLRDKIPKVVKSY